MKMLVHVLIPVHNRVDVTMECLRCLAVQTYRDIKIVVVDDGSTDQTYQKISSTYPDIDILKGDGTLWWTGAMHLGVQHILAYAGNSDYILSLNNDTAFETDFIASLVAMSQKYGRAMVGSMEIDYHHRDRILESGVWIDWNEYRFEVQPGPPEGIPADANEHVNVLPGKGTLIPVEVFQKIGNYDTRRFPHYIADYDFAVRAYNAGCKLIVSYGSRIFTRTDLTGCSRTNGPVPLKEAWDTYFSIRSDKNLIDHIRFIWRHAPSAHGYRQIAALLARAVYNLKIVRSMTGPARTALQCRKDGKR